MFNSNNNFEKFSEKIWLSSPTRHPEMLKYVQEAYNTNWLSTVGENINKIEEEISEKLGCKYAVALSAGTAALHMAIRYAAISIYGSPKVGHGALDGKRVFCSDMTFAATVNPIAYENGIPVFIDSEHATWNMDPKALRKAFEKHPDVKMVVLVHLYGVPAKIDEIREIVEEYGAVLIEDAAESLGATYKEKQTGSFGGYNCLSFNGNKIITGSSGGMFVTDCKEAADMIRKWSTQSRENAPWYQHEDLGYNYRMSNVIAGMIRGQVPYLEEHIAQKKAIYERYREGFKDLPVKMNPYEEDTSKPNFWISCITIEPEAMCRVERSDCADLFIPEHGKTCPAEVLGAIESINAEGRPLWKPMHMQPIYSELEFITGNDTGAAVGGDVFWRGLCLPSDNKMTVGEQDIVIEIIKDCFK